MANRIAAKVDANHSVIRDYLRKNGASVVDCSGAHDGYPDLTVGYGSITVLVEIKDGEKSRSGRKLTEKQTKFFSEFDGAKCVITCEKEAAELIKRLKRYSELAVFDWQIGEVIASNAKLR